MYSNEQAGLGNLSPGSTDFDVSEKQGIVWKGSLLSKVYLSKTCPLPTKNLQSTEDCKDSKVKLKDLKSHAPGSGSTRQGNNGDETEGREEGR